MVNAEYQGNPSCPQRDSAEHEGYVGAQSVGGQEGKEQGGADLLERILNRENLNRAYKRVRANKGAPGIDGMTVEQALPWLREHREELLESIRQGKYKPQPVRRKEIPKPDDPAGNCTAADPHLRTVVLGVELRLPAGQKRADGDRKGEGVRGTGIHPSGACRPVQVF